MNYVANGYVHSGYFRRDSDIIGNFTFDGAGKKIFVNAGVTAINIEDMYSRWVDWALTEDNSRFLPAVRYSGKDVIPGGYTGTTFFLSNGWRLVYDSNQTAVNGILYSDVDQTAYWSQSGNPIYPATVSSLVLASSSTVVAPTASEVANAVWTHSFTSKLLTVAKFLGLK